MNYAEYSKYMANRRDIISINRGYQIKGLPLLPVPPIIEAPKVRIAYLKEDNSYAGRLKEGEECPPECYTKFETALY
jgi:hypothetical protein